MADTPTPASEVETPVADTPVVEQTNDAIPVGAADSGAADPSSAAPDPLLAELSRSLGQDFSGANRDDVLRDIIEARQLREEQQRWQQERAYLQAQIVRQTQPTQAPAQQPTAQTGWSKPEFNPEWLRHVKEDENGNIVPIGAYVDPAIVRGVQQYRDWRRQNSEQFVEDPRSFLLEKVGLKSDLEKLVDERVAAARQQWEQQQQIAQVQTTVFEEMTGRGYFAMAADKQPLRVNGELVPSEAGKRFLAEVDRVMSAYGIADETKAMQLALETLKPAAAPAAPSPLKTLSKNTTNRIPSRRPTQANGVPVEQPRSFVQACMEQLTGQSN